MVCKSINFLIGLLITKINKIFQSGYLFYLHFNTTLRGAFKLNGF